MKVVLLRNLPNLGSKFDIKNVSDGYARNYLIPHGYAKSVDSKSIAELEVQKAAWKKEEEELIASLREVAKRFSAQEFKFPLKADSRGKTFGSVTKNDIRDLIMTRVGDTRENNVEILLDKPIKNLGEHEVEIRLDKGVKTKIKVKIVPED